MSESLLKRDFKKSDVQRIRNLISENYDDSTQTIVGYEHKSEDHKEGDVWEEGKKTWTIKNGLKQSVSRLQSARDYTKTPFLCPKCGKPLNTRLDKKMFPIHGMCFDCVVKFEDDLKRAGLYKEYEKQMMQQNIQAFIKDLRSRIEAMRNDMDNKFTTENGEVEDWGRTSSVLVDGLEEWANLLSKEC